MAESSKSTSFFITGFFDPDFDPNSNKLGRDDTRDDLFEMIDIVNYYRIMGYTDGYVGNPSRKASFPLPYGDYYQSGYSDGHWSRLVGMQN